MVYVETLTLVPLPDPETGESTSIATDRRPAGGIGSIALSALGSITGERASQAK